MDVPYIQQVTDIGGGADGNWACGPTSVAMVLAYYGKLDPWSDYVAAHGTGGDQARLLPGGTGKPAPKAAPSTSKSAPSSSAFAPYVTNLYSYNGHTYSAVAPDPRGNRVAGLYGTICPGGLADWSRMTSVIQWHGLSSKRISTGWDSIVAALKRGHPVLLGNNLTPDGHILVVIGYTNNGHLIVNDPYGNRFASGYGSTSGKGLFYRWKCMVSHAALEVIGTYPPPRSPTPSPTATQVATPSVTATPTATASATLTATALSAGPEASLQTGSEQPSTGGASTGSFHIQWFRTSTPATLSGSAMGLNPGVKLDAGAGEAHNSLERAGLVTGGPNAQGKSRQTALIWWGVLPALTALSLLLILIGFRKGRSGATRSTDVSSTPSANTVEEDS